MLLVPGVTANMSDSSCCFLMSVCLFVFMINGFYSSHKWWENCFSLEYVEEGVCVCVLVRMLAVRVRAVVTDICVSVS